MRHPSHAVRRDYSQTPMNVYWEMTRACDLACKHCRAEAQSAADPDQLSFDEGLELLRQIREFGDPLPQLILTGGDPLTRPDLLPLLEAARALGISASVTPAATARLTREWMVSARAAGMAGLGLSLDAATAAAHDGIRGVPGTFARTLAAMEWARELGLPLQVNTLVAEETVAGLPAVYDLLVPYSPARWSLFFLIAVGRGKMLQPLEPEAAESLMEWIFALARRAPFTVATTEAPSFRRLALQRLQAEGMSGSQVLGTPAARGFGIRDGHGVVFVSHTGEICPAGFLPVVAGNIRRDGLVATYRAAPLFQRLHRPEQFAGRCGVCEYHGVCGGSRARAYAASGDPLGSDPLCSLVSRIAPAAPAATAG